MQQTHCKGMIAFVEGSMEKLFVNKNFPHVELIPISNGESWTVERICAQIESLYRVKDIFADKIIVWLDREGRDETAAEIKEAVLNILVQAGVNQNSILVCIPDRMTENIILADESLIKEEFGLEGYVYLGDGQNGKSKLKSIYKERGENYKETFHGANLLKKTHLSRAALSSASASQFWNDFNFACWWRR